MDLIRQESILEIAAIVLADCAQRLPREKWVHQPNSTEVLTMKSRYGEANSQGVIKISTLFIGTTAWAKLDQTLRHEYAHLAVGVDQHHNQRFKRCLSLFGGDNPVPESELQQISDNNHFKWRVIAHLEDGSTFDLGGVHRKTKKYSTYHSMPPARKTHRLKDSGQRVARYEFLPFSAKA